MAPCLPAPSAALCTFYWGALLPLSRYAASTERMIEAMGIGFLDAVPRMFLSIAVAAWCTALLGLVSGFLGRTRQAAVP